LAFLAKFTELTSLNLAETDVNDAGLANLAKLSNLTTLDLWNTQVGDAGMESVSKLKNLSTLVLDGTQVTAAGIKHLEGLPLKKLFMQSCPLTDEAIESLKKIKTLESVDIKYCVQLTEEAVAELKKAFPDAYIGTDYQ